MGTGSEKSGGRWLEAVLIPGGRKRWWMGKDWDRHRVVIMVIEI